MNSMNRLVKNIIKTNKYLKILYEQKVWTGSEQNTVKYEQ